MNWYRIRPWLGTAVRLVLGIVFIWASASKLNSPRQFTQAVRAYDATPEWLSKAIGYGLPVLEFAVGVLLIVGLAVRIAAAVASVLFVVFLIGLIQAAARGISLTCGCFGGGGTTAGSTSYTLDILRDVGLLVLAAYLVVWSMTNLSIEQFLARNDDVVMPSAKRMRTEQGRRKYEAQLAVARGHARSRDLYLNGSLVLIVVLIAVIGIGVQANRAKVEITTTAKNAPVSTGVTFGKKAAATVDVYEDFGCPVCEQFEKGSHAKLDADVRANLAQVHFHPISILDRNSPNQYSTRAANAALCASDVSVDTFVAYHNILYGRSAGKQVQPTEGTKGPNDLDLISYGRQAQMTAAQLRTFNQCVTGQTYTPVVDAMTEKASERGVTGTPTVYVNGKKLSSPSLASLSAAIKAADAKGPAPHPSVTPTPSNGPTEGESSSGATTPATSSAPASSSPARSSATPTSSAASSAKSAAG